MAKDHYVAQTYLKSFSVSGKIGFVNVIRKSNLQRLDAIPVKSICYAIDWSTNEYFSENPRIVEDYLKIFEPKWADCIKKVSAEEFDKETKYLMSGYIAYLRACTPTAARLGQGRLSEIVQQPYDIIEQKELSNPKIQYRDVIEKIRECGRTRIDVNKNYPKALGIRSLLGIQARLLEFPWIVLKNETAIPFITSDNPVSLQYWNNNPYCDFYCPITPQIAVAIHPTRSTNTEIDSLASMRPEGVEMFNQLVIKCAEENVIFNEALGVEALVKEFQDWRMELLTTKFPIERGSLIVSQERPVKRTTSSAGVSV